MNIPIRGRAAKWWVAAAVGVAIVTTASVAVATSGNGRTNRQGDSVQKALNDAVGQGVPGALALAGGHAYAAGTYNRQTGKPLRVNANGSDLQVRAGSNTKLYVAVSVLQLVQDGKVRLDDPISTYLSGISSPAGTKNPVDSSKITVRQLLNHTAGTVDYLDVIIANGGTSADQILATLRKGYTDQELLDFALKQGSLFSPGAKFAYSNSDYLILGLLVEKITGQSLGTVITNRIIRPLHLADTYVPAGGLDVVDGPHGYASLDGKTLTDVSILDPSALGAAGNMITSIRDASTFTHAVVSTNTLLDAATRKEMTSNLVDARTMTPGADGWQYGLGIVRIALPCGGFAWGHPGNMLGYETWPADAPGKGTATVALTEGPIENAQPLELGILNAAFCGRR